MVLAFDSHLFRQKCNPSSPDYDASINFNTFANELFILNEVWAKRDGLVNVALNEFAEMHGFVINKEKSLLRCNQFAKPKPDRELSKGSLAAGCEFHVKVRADDGRTESCSVGVCNSDGKDLIVCKESIDTKITSVMKSEDYLPCIGMDFF